MNAVFIPVRTLLYISVGILIVSGCTTTKPTPNIMVPAIIQPEPAKPVQIVEVPKVLPLPGQLKPLTTDQSTHASISASLTPEQRVAQANAAARMQPDAQNFINATQCWPYSPDALYHVYASPERITDIAMEEGEELIAVSAGDTVRWVIGDTTSGGAMTSDNPSGNTSVTRVHILVKPIRDHLNTNLVINTNRRTYHLELTSTSDTWMASVSWAYPLDQLKVLKARAAHAETTVPVADGLSLEKLNFRYELSGDTPHWKPLRVFDDGEKVYIQFPSDIAQQERPPLFVVGTKGDAQLVNYRVRAAYYIVDRLFSAAELRLGTKDTAQVVHITRVESIKSAAR